MKNNVVFVVMVWALSVMACDNVSVLPKKPHLPVGSHPCHSDWDCEENFYCGFEHIDTYATCRYSPGYSVWNVSKQ